MKRKIVFFDIDGTLWDWYQIIPQSTVDALKRLRENGHLAILCSGRAKGNINDKKLLDIGFDGMIAACGGYVEYRGEIIKELLLSEAQLRKIIDLTQKHGMPIVLEGAEEFWISPEGFEEDEFVDKIYESMKEHAHTMDGYDSRMRVSKFSADVLETTDYPPIKDALISEFDFIEHGITPDLLLKEEFNPYAIRSVIEVTPKGISKEIGIRVLCEYLGEDIADTYAVGDSMNDLEMISCVGHGIAMGNATEELKKKAEYVTTDIHEDGVMNALRHYGLI